MNRVCVVIPMYGKHEMTKTCIDYTLKNAGAECDIIVIDDGSKDPFYDERVFTLRLPENSGFTNAANQGILWAQEKNYEFIHLLNNDTEPETDFIKHLLDAMTQNPVIGIASSSRLHKKEDGTSFVENHGLDLVRGHQLVSDKDLDKEIVFVEWLPTCSSLMRMEMIREIGLLDKRFRNHCSDAEYCIRANMNGWNVALVTKSRVLHHWSQTTMENNIDPANDQNKFVAKLAGLQYAELMKRMPLDCENKVYGRLQFMVYNK